MTLSACRPQLWLLCLTVCPAPVLAATPGPDAGQLLQVLGGLLAVVVAVLLLARWLPRLQGVRHGGRGQLRVVDSLALGQKERVVLIEVGTRQLLIGVTAHQVSALHALDERLVDARGNEEAGGDAGWLERVLGRRVR